MSDRNHRDHGKLSNNGIIQNKDKRKDTTGTGDANAVMKNATETYGQIRIVASFRLTADNMTSADNNPKYIR